MKLKGNYFFVKKAELKSNYTQIPNTVFDLNLTATEKIILIYLFSNAENFRITNYRIKKAIGSDYRTVNKALDKFKKLNYVYNVNETTIGINVNEFQNSSTITISNSTISNPTISNSTTMDNSNSTTNSSNPTTIMVVELPNNNKKQQDEKNKTQEGKNFSGFEFDEYSKSKYFGNTLNKKLLDYYLQSESMKKHFISYHQFERFFIWVWKTLVKKLNKSFDRPIMIDLLNTDFNYWTDIISKVDLSNINYFKSKPDEIITKELKEFEIY